MEHEADETVGAELGVGLGVGVGVGRVGPEEERLAVANVEELVVASVVDAWVPQEEVAPMAIAMETKRATRELWRRRVN